MTLERNFSNNNYKKKFRGRGASLSIVGHSSLDALDFWCDLNHIEINLFTNYSVLDIIEYAEKRNWTIGAHAPLHKRLATRYEITGPNEDSRKRTVEEILKSHEIACRYNMKYLVVNFPSPWNEIYPCCLEEQIHKTAQSLNEASKDSGTPICIENLSANRAFNTPNSYFLLLSEYLNLGFCLDIGHALLFDPTSSVESFINILRNRINVVHLWIPGPTDGKGHWPMMNDHDKTWKWLLPPQYSKKNQYIQLYDYLIKSSSVPLRLLEQISCNTYMVMEYGEPEWKKTFSYDKSQ